ncbi:MAG TPA: hypothetical protein VFF98_06940 [Novosphingobium sp.]|nr:hypothetical protein [Novosphingobium sp.]
MTTRTPIGWQTMLADLSLILFMVTAAAMAEKPGDARPAPPPPPPPPPVGLADPARAEPLAIWRARAGGPGLAAWLASQPADPRQQLTITARCRPGGQKAAIARAEALLHEAGAGAAAARIIVQTGGSADLYASLAYDRAPG